MIGYYEGNYQSTDGMRIYYYNWTPQEKPKAVIQLVHGMAEKGMRYEETAKFFADKGYAVYINDHRGHGKTAAGDYGYMGEGDVFLKMVRDMKLLHDIIRENHPDTKIFLLGHSMGSLLSLRYAQIYPEALDGLLLSGTGGPDQIKGAALMQTMTAITRMVFGDRKKSVYVEWLNNKMFNRKIKPLHTQSDWICSDPAVVEKFREANDMCFTFSASAYYYMGKGLRENFLQTNLSTINKKMPIYMFSGKEDPLGNYGKGVKSFYEFLRDTLGMQAIQCKLYNGRHELLNEFVKEQVREDILRWMDEQLI